jgi:hypothetical protein
MVTSLLPTSFLSVLEDAFRQGGHAGSHPSSLPTIADLEDALAPHAALTPELRQQLLEDQMNGRQMIEEARQRRKILLG